MPDDTRLLPDRLTTLKRWFAWCQSNGPDPLVGIQRAHVELYIRRFGEPSSSGAALRD